MDEDRFHGGELTLRVQELTLRVRGLSAEGAGTYAESAQTDAEGLPAVARSAKVGAWTGAGAEAPAPVEGRLFAGDDEGSLCVFTAADAEDDTGARPG